MTSRSDRRRHQHHAGRAQTASARSISPRGRCSRSIVGADSASDSRPTTIRMPRHEQPEIVGDHDAEARRVVVPERRRSRWPRRRGRSTPSGAIGIRSPGSRNASAIIAAMRGGGDAGHRHDRVERGHHRRSRSDPRLGVLRRARCPAASGSASARTDGSDRPAETGSAARPSGSPAATIGTMTQPLARPQIRRAARSSSFVTGP